VEVGLVGKRNIAVRFSARAGRLSVVVLFIKIKIPDPPIYYRAGGLLTIFSAKGLHRPMAGQVPDA
jgi:hypothetical protein